MSAAAKPLASVWRVLGKAEAEWEGRILFVVVPSRFGTAAP